MPPLALLFEAFAKFKLLAADAPSAAAEVPTLLANSSSGEPRCTQSGV
jgi:hypothetical protein